MRFLSDFEPGEPRRGLAIDEALLDSVRSKGEEIVRLWVNDRAVVVGRSQSVHDEVDLDFSARSAIPVLRRISGGGTVYHYPGNLNVSIVLRGGRRIRSVRETFRFFGAAMAAGLRETCSAISFDENDLLIGDAKVGGAAQARRGGALLYHTTLLVRPADVPMERLLLAMRPGYRTDYVPSRPRETISLSETLGQDLPLKRVAEILVPFVSSALSRTLVEGVLTEEEAQRVGWLVEHKYGDPEWNRSL